MVLAVYLLFSVACLFTVHEYFPDSFFQIVYFLVFKHFQFLMPVGFHAVFAFRKAVMFIRNDEPQNIPPGFTDLFQPHDAVLIDTGNHIAVTEGLPALYLHTHCVQKIADMFLGKVQHHLEIRVPVFLHSVCMGITKYADSISPNSCPVRILTPSCLPFSACCLPSRRRSGNPSFW